MSAKGNWHIHSRQMTQPGFEPRSFHCASKYCIIHRCKKRFMFFYSGHVFFTFFNVFFYFPTFFIFKNVHWKYHLKSFLKQWKQIGSVWLFFFVSMLEFPYRPIYWQALLFTDRIGLHQVTPLGVVFLFMSINWWVEKHQRSFIQRLQTFYYFSHVFFTFFNVFYFFLERFFYIYGIIRLQRRMRNTAEIIQLHSVM